MQESNFIHHEFSPSKLGALLKRLALKRAEIVVRDRKTICTENNKTAFMTACKAYGNIV